MHFPGTDKITIPAGKTNSPAAIVINKPDDFLIDPANQYHLHHVHGLTIGHPHALHIIWFDLKPIKQIIDLGSTSMNDNDIDAYMIEKNDIKCKLALEVLIYHGMAAILDNNRLMPEFLNIGQRFHQDFGSRYTFFHHSSPSRSSHFMSA